MLEAPRVGRARWLGIGCVWMVGACGDAPASGGDAGRDPDRDAAGLDAQQVDDAAPDSNPDGAPAAACAAIDLVSNDLEAWRAATVEWLWQAGQAGAHSERQSDDTVAIYGLRAPIDARDLGTGSIDWLLTLPNFPVPAAEIEVLEVKQIFEDSATVVLGRPRIGATRTRIFRPLAGLSLGRSAADGRWSVQSLTVWGSTALMGEAEAIALEACSPHQPPPRAPLYEAEFQGLVIRACAITGTYSYQPNARDTIEYGETVDWVVMGAQWRARRAAVLTIDEANFFDGIEGADCYCDGVAGFELFADASRGELLEYRPGIRCVVC